MEDVYKRQEFESRKAAGKYTNHFRKYDYMFNGSLHLYVADREFILNGEVEEDVYKRQILGM